MIPKIIHICWFSNNPFPIEIKRCLRTWEKHMPDYTIKRWTYNDALNIGCDYINEALQLKKWAFAADVVRFYAIWKEGGIYMDSDIFLYKSIERLIPEHGFATFNEKRYPWQPDFKLQAACFMGEASNEYCKQVIDYYMNHHFVRENGKLDLTISPHIMAKVAREFGVINTDRLQRTEKMVVYPTWYLLPSSKYKRVKSSVGRHKVYGSWRKRKWGRKVELLIKHMPEFFLYRWDPIGNRISTAYRAWKINRKRRLRSAG